MGVRSRRMLRRLCRLCARALRSERLTTECPLHLSTRRCGSAALRQRCIECIPRSIRTARRHHGRGRTSLGGAAADAVKARRITAARLHLGKHGDVRLCDRAQRLILRLGTFQRTREHLAALLDPLDLLVKVGIVLLQVLLIRRREFLPLPQLLPNLHLAVRVAVFVRLLRLIRPHPARLYGRPHRLCKALPRLDAVLHLAPEVLHLRIVADSSNSLKKCHTITSV